MTPVKSILRIFFNRSGDSIEHQVLRITSINSNVGVGASIVDRSPMESPKPRCPP